MNIDIKTADGANIELGGIYYKKDGTPFHVSEIRWRRYIDTNGLFCKAISIINRNADDLCRYACSSDLYFKKPEPDSWEKLEEDIMRGDGSALSVCGYFNFQTVNGCNNCPAQKRDNKSCATVAMLDVLRRAKKLAGVE